MGEFLNIMIASGVNKEMKTLFDGYGTLGNIMKNNEAAKKYHLLMLKVISYKEFSDGNYTTKGMNYKLNKSYEEVVNKYGGSVLLPKL